jgi:nucleoside transporter
MTNALNYSPYTGAPPLTVGMHARLSLMMLLQYAIQGAWLPLLFPYLNEFRGFSDSSVGWLAAAGAIGAVVSPFLAGQLADRYMNAELFLCIAHIVGAAVVWVLAEVTNYQVLLGLSFFYGVLYTPTLGVTNAIAFAHLPDRDRDFGKIRVFGTIGWILVGIGIGQWLLHKAGATNRPAQVMAMKDAFRLSAILGVIQGLYALTLPKTPPKREEKSYAPGEAMAEIAHQPLATIFLISIPISAVHQFFFARTAQFLGQLKLDAPWADKVFGVGGAGLMTVGQISEIIVLAMMPLVVKSLNKKTILTIGLLAYFLRFMIFAYFPYAWALIPGLALHGFVFGCFFFVCFMIVDEFTTKDVRSSAQNLFNLIVFGAGVIIGNLAAGWIAEWTRVDGQMNWRTFYAIPGWATLACLVIFLLAYPRRPVPLAERAKTPKGGFEPLPPR